MIIFQTGCLARIAIIRKSYSLYIQILRLFCKFHWYAIFRNRFEQWFLEHLLQDAVLINEFLNDCTCTGAYFLDKIIGIFPEMFPRTCIERSANSIVHMENTKPQTLRQTKNSFLSCKLVHAAQPSYGRDISPYDFFFFRCMKNHLRESEYKKMDHLKRAVGRVLGEIPIDLFTCIFKRWVERMNQIMNINRD
jgi:hypothetical protein